MKREIETMKMMQLAETSKFNLLSVLKKRDHSLCNFKLEETVDELKDFKSWFDILTTHTSVRLNGLATFIGIVGLTVAVVVLVALLVRYFTGTTQDSSGATQFVKGKTSISDIVDDCVKIFTIAVSIHSTFANLSKLKSLWLERVHVPELYNTTIPMKHLHKMSLILCKINNSFDQTGVDVSSIFPKLEDLTIDHCDDLVTLPSTICGMTSLSSLSITNCPRVSELPKNLSKLQALELLRLYACPELKALPVEICELPQRKYLDISQCVSLSCLPEDIGKLGDM